MYLIKKKSTTYWNLIICESLLKNFYETEAATMAQSVKECAPQAGGWLLESQPRKT